MSSSVRRGCLLAGAGFCLLFTSSQIQSRAPAAVPEANVPIARQASPHWVTQLHDFVRRSEYNLTWQNGESPGLPGAYQAPNRAHNLRTYFTSRGVTVVPRRGDGSWQIGLRWVDAPRMVEPRAQGNRVEYDYGGVTEWFVNDHRGLEHGFTIHEPQSELSDGSELRLRLEWNGDGLLRQDTSGGINILTSGGRPVARYAGLHAFDGNHRALSSRMVVSTSNTIELHVESAGASYPILIDPLLTGIPDATLQSDQADALLGISVAGAGDVNGDGYDDVIVGASFYDAAARDGGAAFVFHGSATGVASANPATAHARLTSRLAGAAFGVKVAAAGDVNGDGYDDVLVAATRYSDPEVDEGAVFVFHGSAQGIRSGDQRVANATLQSNQASAFFGVGLAAGDVDDDGYGDVIIGAPRYDIEKEDRGAAFVFRGGKDGIVSGDPESALHAILWINAAGAQFGYSVAGAGDVNGDGFSDVIVGAPRYSSPDTDEGAAFVFHGSRGGIRSLSPPSATLQSDQPGAFLGISVAGAGDVNADGFGDIVVGAHDYDAGQNDEGAAFVFQGSAAGIPSGGPDLAKAIFQSNQDFTNFGESVAGAGDLNGDGYSDMIVGARSYEPPFDPNEPFVNSGGAAFVFHGASTIHNGNPLTANATLRSDQDFANFGISVAGAGDVDGDGAGDVIVGSHVYDLPDNNEGAAFVYRGTPPAPVPLGAEFRVNFFGQQGAEYDARVAAERGWRDFVVVWTHGSDGSSSGIAHSWFQSSGSTLFQTNLTTSGTQQNAAVAIRTSTSMIVWESDGQADDAAQGIAARQWLGANASPEFRVNTNTAGNQISAAVGVGGISSFMAVWNDLSGSRIMGRIYGFTPSAEFPVGDADAASVPSISHGDDGSFAVAWDTYNLASQSRDIFARRFDITGAPLSSAQVVNTATGSDESAPRVSSKPSGGFVVAWQTEAGEVAARAFDSTGSPLSPSEVQVNVHTALLQHRPAVALQDRGQFVVVWESEGQDGSGAGIFGRQFRFDGLPSGGEFRINQSTTGAQARPDVAAHGNGEFIVTWDSDAGGERKVFARHFSMDSDGDGRPDASDNCLLAWNPGQQDSDADGLGEVCDNCSNVTNPAQEDGDSDTVGNACDNCPGIANQSQFNDDQDAHGNVCDACPRDPSNDEDLDQICGDVDNCPTLSNRFQTNNDGDSQGDRCDPNDDNDTFEDATDKCPYLPSLNNADADGDGWGDACERASGQFQINANFNADPSKPSIALHDNGRFVVVWSNQYQRPSGLGATPGIFGRSFSPTGIADSEGFADFQVSDNTAADQRDAEIAIAGDESFVVVWEAGSAIRGQRFSRTNTRVGPEFVISASTLTSSLPDVAMTDTGDFIVVWKGYEGILARQYDSQGTPRAAPFFVGAGYDPSSPAVATDPNGNFVIAWDAHQGAAGRQIFGRRGTNSGTVLDQPFVVNTHTPGTQFHPTVGRTDNGDFVVAWSEPGPENGIRALRLNADGTRIGTDFPVSAEDDRSHDVPSLAIDPAGNFVVSWGIGTLTYQEYVGFGLSGDNVLAKRYASNGSPVAPQFQVNSNTTGTASDPAIAINASGKFVVTWISHDDSGNIVKAAISGDAIPGLSITDVTVTEGHGGTVNAVFTVTKSVDTLLTSTVDFATADMSASGIDYLPQNGTLSFGSGEMTKTISVVITGDSFDEPDETFAVNLSNPTNATIVDSQGSGTITDDDAAPNLTISDSSVTEGNSGAVPMVFTLGLSNASGRPVTVNFATGDGSATAANDYTASSGTVTFDPFSTSQTLSVPVLGDTIGELHETFNVNLTNATNATIVDNLGIGTIHNDDATISINDVSVSEGASAVFTVTLSQPNVLPVSVNYATADGSATAPDDYTATSAILDFAPGVVSRNVSVSVAADATAEPNETFNLNLSDAINASITRGSGVATIGPVRPRADWNGDGSVHILDVFYLLNHLFAQGAAPVPGSGDVNGDAVMNVGDAIYLLQFLFGTGPAPPG